MSKLSKLIEHLKQPSTIRGLITLFGVFGVCVEPSKLEEIAVAVGTVVSLYEIVRDGDRK